MNSQNYVFVTCLVIFTAHSVQPWDGLGVITKASIQFFKDITFQKTAAVQWKQNEVNSKYEPVEHHEYITEKQIESINSATFRLEPIAVESKYDPVEQDEHITEKPTNPTNSGSFQWTPIQVEAKDDSGESHVISYIGKKMVNPVNTAPIEYEHNDMIVTYDPVGNYEYISDKPTSPKNGNIYRIKNTENSEHPTVELVIADQPQNVMGFAYNKFTNTLYWTSGNTIKYAWISNPMKGIPSNGNVLLNLNDSTPSAIQIDACRGYLYYTNWLKNVPSNAVTIERMRLDGSEREVLLCFRNTVLIGLAFDTADNELYWGVMDPSMKHNQFSIERLDLESGSRKTVIEGMDHMPRGFALDEKDLLWFDARSKVLWSSPKDGSVFPTEVLKYEDNNNQPTRIMAASPCSPKCCAAYKTQTEEFLKPNPSETAVRGDDVVYKPSQTEELLKNTFGQYPLEVVEIQIDDKSTDGIRLPSLGYLI